MGIILIYIINMDKCKNFNKFYQLVISINVHENPPFLKKQLDNINKYVKCNYIIILNCNDYMFNKLQQNDSFITKLSNIIINPIYFNKRTFHGSLTRGIYLNMIHILKNYIFNRFLVMSSREFFYNELNNIMSIPHYYGDTHPDYVDYSIWWWPIFSDTKIFKYFKVNDKKSMSSSAHEGLMLDYNNCITIKNYFETNQDIKDDTFNLNMCIEEFALQTICYNKNGYYYYIGNGVHELHPSTLPQDRYTYKIRRE